MEKIALSGFMASGKSTIGKELSKQTILQNFVDNDKFIETYLGGDLKTFIATYGMEKFRKMETWALGELVKGDANNIALGGGAVTIGNNIEILKGAGFKIIYLQNSFSIILERILLDNEGNSNRVDMNKSKLKELYDSRQVIYNETADIVIVNNGSIDETVEAIGKALKIQILTNI